MGKKLVIKDADFSANGIYIPDPLLSFFPLTLGVAWSINGTTYSPHRAADNPARASQETYVEINGADYGTISLKAKSGYKFAVYFGASNIPDTPGANLVQWAYYEDNVLTLDITSARYAIIMVASTDNSALESTDINTYIEQV